MDLDLVRLEQHRQGVGRIHRRVVTGVVSGGLGRGEKGQRAQVGDGERKKGRRKEEKGVAVVSNALAGSLDVFPSQLGGR